MGRSKYTPETRNAVMASFVTAMKGIVDESGLEGTSIRRVSLATGYSSATLYLYFEDINELIMMSLISYLSDYVTDIVESTPENESPEEAYRRSWQLFCKHAFAHPAIFLNLFFGPQSDKLNVIAKKYYELFPEELEQASGTMFDMLERGSLLERNRILLTALADEIGLTEHEADLANDLTLAFFHSFLQEASQNNYSEGENTTLTDRFIEGAFFVLRGSCADE
ncbi:MAG: TetR/AcrR family transcriptional regulator [Eggerthellaceae bacterium]|nr:TetR/AcrR family transcriptional regulator [Eggerthellaceae bacterium]